MKNIQKNEYANKKYMNLYLYFICKYKKYNFLFSEIPTIISIIINK